MKYRNLIACAAAAIMLAGCSGATGNAKATDPTERAGSYIAAAIVTSAILRALFNH